ncbi:histidine phosphatase superfamily [Aspergillus karnatakaensis]|uniref:histidine phosphatase family protein n=1 Tax=Aspergillus karnatakaensis TaxID=1810916 RepID=UPI003CCD49F5
MRWVTLTLLAASGATALAVKDQTTTGVVPTSTTEPDWFQTRPQSYEGSCHRIGVTATGSAPMLAETNPVYSGQKTFIANDPLQTSQPIQGSKGRNIFHLMGNLSPYFVPEEGFGVDEYPLPKGSNISQVHLIHRHGSRYPSDSETIGQWAQSLANATATFTGALSFLNNYTWNQGINILVPKGRQELFESGVSHFYNYGALYNTSSKLIVRSTTSDRALKSAENFLAGFFGLEWRNNANILPLISGSGFNSSLTGMSICKNAAQVFSSLENDAMKEWQTIYLKHRTHTLQKHTGTYNWTVTDTANAQTLCAYETVSFGYSPFCSLFTYAEWQGYSYASSIMSSSLMGFGSPISRASGIAWVQEFLARVNGHLLDIPAGASSANLTLDTNPVTFPLDQSLFFDFGHDASIMAALSAFGITQFAQHLPATGPPRNQQFHADRVTPFAGRLNIEIIDAPRKVRARRSRKGGDEYIPRSGRASYMHFMLNQRTVPLHASFEECEYRDDGWCELETFLKVQERSLEKARFEYSCEGDWDMGAYGGVTDGVPPQ